MNIEPENSKRPDGDDPLDQLLNEARWPTATTDRETQFAQRWREVWRVQRRRERLALRSAVLGIAATLLVAATVGWKWWHSGGNPIAQPVTVKQPAAAPIRGKDSPVANESRVPRMALRPMSTFPPAHALAQSSTRSPMQTDVADERVLYRPPNELEEMLVAALVRRGTTHKRPASVRLPSEAPTTGGPANLPVVRSSDARTKTRIAKATKEAAQDAVAHLVADPKADPSQIAASLRAAAPLNESRLLAILTNSGPPEQIAAARLLGEIGNPGTVPYLLRASADPSLHVATIGALSRIADSPGVAMRPFGRPVGSRRRRLSQSLSEFRGRRIDGGDRLGRGRPGRQPAHGLVVFAIA